MLAKVQVRRFIHSQRPLGIDHDTHSHVQALYVRLLDAGTGKMSVLGAAMRKLAICAAVCSSVSMLSLGIRLIS